MVAEFRVAGVGEVLWDAFPEGEKFGGATANFACHCASLGAQACAVSCVGDDARGRRARDFLEDHGVLLSGLAVDAAHETGYVRVCVDPEGVPAYEIRENVAWDHIPWTGELATLAAGMDAVCFGTLCQRSTCSRETIRRFLTATPVPCLRVFDVNLRQRFYDDAILHDSLTLANVLKLNDEELPIVASMFRLRGPDEEVARALLTRFGLRLVALTRGGLGAMLVTEEETRSLPAPEVRVVDTVGAGDCFTAALTMGLLGAKPLAAVLDHALAAAAFVCGQAGAVPRLPKSLC